MVRGLAKHPVVTFQARAASAVEPAAQPNAKPGSSVVQNRFVAVQNPRIRGTQRPRRAGGYQRRDFHSLGPPQEIIRLAPQQALGAIRNKVRERGSRDQLRRCPHPTLLPRRRSLPLPRHCAARGRFSAAVVAESQSDVSRTRNAQAAASISVVKFRMVFATRNRVTNAAKPQHAHGATAVS